MGSGRELNSQKSASPLDVIKYLDELFVYAFSIGMTYDQYWYGEPKLINLFIKAEKLKQRKRNNEMWLQGLYIYQAVGGLIHLANPFSKEHRAKPYLKQPIPLTQEEVEEQEREKYNRFVEYMKKRAEVSKK